MNDLASVVSAIDDLERIHAELALVAARTDPERGKDLVRLRRLLSTQIGLVGRIAEPLFAGHPDEHSAFRRLYSAMRSAAALHQANWPAIRLGEDDVGYRKSALVVQAANHALTVWLRMFIRTGLNSDA